MEFHLLDGLHGAHPRLGDLILYLDDAEVSDQCIVELLQETGLPLYDGQQFPVVWDEAAQALSYRHWTVANGDPSVRARDALQSPKLDDARDPALRQFLLHLSVMTRYGFKPMIVREAFLAPALRGERVPRVEECRSQLKAFHDCHLVYFNDCGQVSSAPFTTVLKLLGEVTTRSGIFWLTSRDMVYCSLPSARFVADAFVLAATKHPRSCGKFGRARATAVFVDEFQSLVVEPREVPTFGDETGLAQREILFTEGPHPLDAELVTTPELHEAAVRRLTQFGRRLRYSAFCDDVEVVRVEPLPTAKLRRR